MVSLSANGPYDQDWHDVYGKTTSHSAISILGYLLDILKPNSLVEVGCGHGHWLEAASKLGTVDLLGIDGPWTDTNRLLIPREIFRSADLGQKLDVGRMFDLVVTAEVAEHISPEYSEQFVNNLCDLGRVVLFGAAIPLQGGFRHINEQWPSHWVAKFEARGYLAFDVVRPKFWTDQSIHYYYRQNLLVFAHRSHATAVEQLSEMKHRLCDEAGVLDLVHPEKFYETASYESIVLKRCLPKLPGAVVTTLKRTLNRLSFKRP